MFTGGAPRCANEAIGGWSISGLADLPYRPGGHSATPTPIWLPLTTSTLPSSPATRADLKAKVNVDHNSNTVYTFAGGADGAAKVLAEFRGPIGIEYGQRNRDARPRRFLLLTQVWGSSSRSSKTS